MGGGDLSCFSRSSPSSSPSHHRSSSKEWMKRGKHKKNRTRVFLCSLSPPRENSSSSCISSLSYSYRRISPRKGRRQGRKERLFSFTSFVFVISVLLISREASPLVLLCRTATAQPSQSTTPCPTTSRDVSASSFSSSSSRSSSFSTLQMSSSPSSSLSHLHSPPASLLLTITVALPQVLPQQEHPSFSSFLKIVSEEKIKGQETSLALQSQQNHLGNHTRDAKRIRQDHHHLYSSYHGTQGGDSPVLSSPASASSSSSSGDIMDDEKVDIRRHQEEAHERKRKEKNSGEEEEEEEVKQKRKKTPATEKTATPIARLLGERREKEKEDDQEKEGAVKEEEVKENMIFPLENTTHEEGGRYRLPFTSSSPLHLSRGSSFSPSLSVAHALSSDGQILTFDTLVTVGEREEEEEEEEGSSDVKLHSDAERTRRRRKRRRNQYIVTHGERRRRKGSLRRPSSSLSFFSSLRSSHERTSCLRKAGGGRGGCHNKRGESVVLSLSSNRKVELFSVAILTCLAVCIWMAYRRVTSRFQQRRKIIRYHHNDQDVSFFSLPHWIKTKKGKATSTLSQDVNPLFIFRESSFLSASFLAAFQRSLQMVSSSSSSLPLSSPNSLPLLLPLLPRLWQLQAVVYDFLSIVWLGYCLVHLPYETGLSFLFLALTAKVARVYRPLYPFLFQPLLQISYIGVKAAMVMGNERAFVLDTVGSLGKKLFPHKVKALDWTSLDLEDRNDSNHDNSKSITNTDNSRREKGSSFQ
ncbi:hypothetical protein CSUI_009514 [Cystoisospora suis]|uniref:Uncharacterized protein n=1 Tax=Cystoisospora suis TaxID=483139 RepID=A0A2C6KGJ4_9APIC|nr:hypothetical protein CSUI_009514 [Cystoisospora suis]